MITANKHSCGLLHRLQFLIPLTGTIVAEQESAEVGDLVRKEGTLDDLVYSYIVEVTGSG